MEMTVKERRAYDAEVRSYLDGITKRTAAFYAAKERK
jgi:hypothetical protein